MSQLTRLSLANRAVIVLATLVTIGLGLFTTATLRQELIPSLTIPGAFIITTYPGASPATIETDVTKPIEDAVRPVTGVTKVSSTSTSNVSQVNVEWDYQADRAEMESKIRTAVDGLTATLPADVTPTVTTGSFDDVPIVYLAVSSDAPPEVLADKLDKIAVPALRGLEGVRLAGVSGQQELDLVIQTRQADLDRLKVDPSQITQIMAMYKAVIPAGQISTGGQDQLVQVGKTLTSPDDVLALQLQGSDGPVTLRDVADVALVPKTVTSISRVNGKPSLSLAVIKTPEANTVAVAAAVREALPGIAEEIGDNVQFETVFDQAPYIEQSIHDLATEGGLGLVMAVLVVLLFLWSVRPTVITAVSIPLSLLIAMIALWLADYTLNLLTLSALTVAVGRVVDDSIVVIENIKRHQSLGEEFGAGLILRAVKEVAGAVTASTITTVAVFAPISLVSGQTGELFRPFGLTITVALLASLLVSLTIVPVLSSWFMRPSRRPVDPGKLARRQSREQQLLAAEHAREERARAREEERLRLREEKLVNKLTLRAGADEATVAAALANLRARHQTGAPASTVNHEAHEFAQTRLQRGYLPVLRWALRHPVVSLVLAAVIFVGTMAMTPLLKTDFIGDAGQTSLTINQSMPAGTTLAQTDEAAKKVEAVLAAQPSMLSYQTTVGGDVLEAAFTGASAGSNKATINVTLKPGSQGVQVADDLRAAFAKMKDVGEVEVMTADGGTGSTAITVQVQGPDPTALAAGADQVQTMLAGVDGVSQVTSDLGEQQTVLQVSLNEPVAAANGMSQVSVGMAANEALQGSPLGEIVVGGIRRDVVLRSRPAITTVEELQSLPLPVTQKQTMDAQKAASDELKADAERQQEQAVAEARSGRAKLADQLSQLRSQLQSLQSAPVVMAPVVPTAPDPGLTQAAQVRELQGAIAELEAQLSALDKQIGALQDQREKAADQQYQSDEMTRRQEAIPDITGQPLLLSQVATVTAVPAPAAIRRVDGVRSVTISAIAGGGDLGAATAAITTGLASLHLPGGVTATIGGVSQEQADAFKQLFLAMAIAVAIVYMVMVATFRSLLQPVILLVSVPFAATGAIGLLLISGTPLGVPAMIGMLMLIGIVVTNAIVLIDLVNHYRSGGASIDDAVIHGARLRLRPIVMTALATITALLPMALGVTGGGVFISGSLAVVVIGGLVSSTALTLLLVPVLYHLVETGKLRLRHRQQPLLAGVPADDEEDLDGLTDMLDSSVVVDPPARSGFEPDAWMQSPSSSSSSPTPSPSPTSGTDLSALPPPPPGATPWSGAPPPSTSTPPPGRATPSERDSDGFG